MDIISPFSDTFLQVLSNATGAAIPFIQNAAQNNAIDGVQNSTNTLAGLVTTVAVGLVGKHFYDSKKRDEITNVASDIDRMQMVESADNYNDFSDVCGELAEFLEYMVKNPDAKPTDILNTVVDDITKQTLGVRMITKLRDIQKYNIEYYKNTAYKPNSVLYKSNNPLKNVRNLVRDVSIPSSS